MKKSLCGKCKHKASCDTTLYLYGLPNMRVYECKAFEPKEKGGKKNEIDRCR